MTGLFSEKICLTSI